MGDYPRDKVAKPPKIWCLFKIQSYNWCLLNAKIWRLINTWWYSFGSHSQSYWLRRNIHWRQITLTPFGGLTVTRTAKPLLSSNYSYMSHTSVHIPVHICMSHTSVTYTCAHLYIYLCIFICIYVYTNILILWRITSTKDSLQILKSDVLYWLFWVVKCARGWHCICVFGISVSGEETAVSKNMGEGARGEGRRSRRISDSIRWRGEGTPSRKGGGTLEMIQGL